MSGRRGCNIAESGDFVQDNKEVWPSAQYRNTVCVNGAGEYSYELLREILREQLRLLGAGEFIRPGMRVVIKPNLVVRAEPDSAAVTHPLVTAAAAACLKELGASVVVAESSGGVYTPAALKSIYNGTGYTEMAQTYGIELNYDCSSGELKAPEGLRCKGFTVITPILEADAVVDICKLKSHCMTGLSAAVKNLFGCVPGLMKPELHCRFPEKPHFGEMLADLCCAVKPEFCIVDGVTAMEGNGPTGGRPRHMGAILSGRNPFAVDIACSALVSMKPEEIHMLRSGMERGLSPRSAEELEVLGDPLKKYIQPDFLQPESKTSNFIEKLPRFLRPLAARLASPAPKIRREECVGCGKCTESCPQHTIRIEGGKASIDYGGCIRCYCCHEMCPKHVIDIRRLPLFRL